ncbi:MAG: SDR family NAD(P)-dependent oxidoreductase [Acidimicrobiales bacterium]
MENPTRRRALVTGASVGIGKAFAEELARRGNDLVLVARNTEQLEELAQALERRHGISAEVLAADLSSPADIARVVARFSEGSQIDVLINNAGRGAHEPFATSPLSDHLAQIDLNVRALVELCSAALSVMVPRGSGAVLNVASVAAFQPVPHEAVYGATKAFVLSLTEALHVELKGTGVKVTALCPGFTRSEFQKRAGIASGGMPDFMWQEASEVAVAGLNALEAGKAVCVPGAHNKVLAGVTKLTPRSVLRASSGVVTRRLG